MFDKKRSVEEAERGVDSLGKKAVDATTTAKDKVVSTYQNIKEFTKKNPAIDVGGGIMVPTAAAVEAIQMMYMINEPLLEKIARIGVLACVVLNVIILIKVFAG